MQRESKRVNLQTGSLDLAYMTQLCEQHSACGPNGGCVERHDDRTGHVVDIRCE